MAFEHDLGLGGHPQRHRLAGHEFDLAPAQQPGELVFGEGVGHRGDRGEDGARIGPDDDRAGQRLGLRLAPAAVMLGAAAMAQPAHQRGVFPRYLHPVNAEIDRIRRRPARPLGDHEGPGDERCGLARPAGLDGKVGKVDGVALDHHLLAGRMADLPGFHGHGGLDQRQQRKRLAPAARRLGLAQEGQRFAQRAQLAGLAVHAPGDPLDRAEQIDQDGHGVGRAVGAYDVLEHHGRPAFGDQAGLDLGHLEMGRDRLRDAHEPARVLEPGDEIAKRGIGHEASREGALRGCAILLRGCDIIEAP